MATRRNPPAPLVATKKEHFLAVPKGSPRGKQRIILALYRFFVSCDLLLLLSEGPCGDSDDILKIWRFWRTISVRVVKDFLLKKVSRNGGWKIMSRLNNTSVDTRFPVIYEFSNKIPMRIDRRANREHLEKRA
ncbi:hypothetical protein EYR41_004220 [Orbilia oligospora]|uniref:Uncharacterized protein n=1 Tax=Orbilia oligospora TaxID=2813651 RepID=A0A8H2HV34_ORBOL|nr:hypothetical protein EYR41_004220 [Orbilia oligospora]